MTTHTEAREAVARILFSRDESMSSKAYMWEDYGSDVHEEYRLEADAILARLGELGYVQRDRLTSEGAVEAACATGWKGWLGEEHSFAKINHEVADRFRNGVRAAIAAAIAKAGEGR